MSQIQFYGTAILFEGTQIAFDPACCCAVVFCDYCEDDEGPEIWDLTFDDWTDLAGCSSTDCVDKLNVDTFELSDNGLDECQWEGATSFDYMSCGGDDVGVSFTLGINNSFIELGVHFSYEGVFNVTFRFRKSITAPIDCTVPHTLTYHSTDSGGGTSTCTNWTNVTATITPPS